MFTNDDFVGASEAYKRAVKFLVFRDQDSEADRARLEAAGIPCWNNLAAVQIKLKKFKRAVESASTVLLMDPDNVKALFRKAKVRLTRTPGARRLANGPSATCCPACKEPRVHPGSRFGCPGRPPAAASLANLSVASGSPAWTALAQAHSELRQWAKALDILKRAASRELSPGEKTVSCRAFLHHRSPISARRERILVELMETHVACPHAPCPATAGRPGSAAGRPQVEKGRR